MIPVTLLCGVGGIPRDRKSASKWLVRNGVPINTDKADGRNPEVVNLSDLPEEVRRAYTVKALAALDLDPGTYDEEAHAALVAAPAGMRAEAERKAGVMRMIRAGRNAGLGRAAVHRAVWDAFGKDGNSAKSLDRWEAQVRGVDPVNFAAVLLDGYKGGAPKADISEEAWTLFEGGLKAAFLSHRFMALYLDVKAIAEAQGWSWPSYSTVMRRVHALPVAEQEALRKGRDEALRRLYQPTLRNSTSLRAMEWVVLDGRTVDVWVAWPDGRILRPTVLGLVDQASGKVLDIEFAASENTQATCTLERRAFKRFGAPDNLLTDNGPAFSGHGHAGQVPHKHRNKGNRRIKEEPPGIFKHLGFNLHFALPRNAQAKLMERKFADRSREIDTAPEFMGAHAGSHPGERPEGDIVPVPYDVFERVYRAKIDAYNARSGRKSQGCLASGTASYDAAFKARSQGRARKVLTEEQLRLATLEWTLSTVQPDGRVRGKDGWIYGEDLEDNAQDALLRFVGRKVWVGTNPLDRSEPAIVWNPADDRLIHKAVHAVVRGAFDDAEGARHSARKKAHLRKQTKRVADLDAAEAQRILQEYWMNRPATAEDAAEEETVVQPNFKRTVRPRREEDQGQAGVVTIAPRKSFITAEMRENQRRAYSGGDG
jgi:putative transposase